MICFLICPWEFDTCREREPDNLSVKGIPGQTCGLIIVDYSATHWGGYRGGLGLGKEVCGWKSFYFHFCFCLLAEGGLGKQVGGTRLGGTPPINGLPEHRQPPRPVAIGLINPELLGFTTDLRQ
jgi:hypothetical protein